MSPQVAVPPTRSSTPACSSRSGGRSRDHALLDLALTHRSYCAEHGIEESNERLEFLGDSVLGFVVTTFVYDEYPQLPEGELAKLRAAVVSAETLARARQRASTSARALRLGKGEDASGGRAKPSILADAMEAVIAAVYLDGGLDAAPARDPRGARGARSASRPPGPAAATTRRGCRSSRHSASTSCPRYQVRHEGPDHSKRFFASVLLRGEVYGTGEGRSKKAAEQAAARDRVGAAAGRGDQRLRRPGTVSGWAMPELPEVEVVRRDLEREVVGKKVKSVEVDGMRAVRRHHNRKQFANRLVGKKITGVERRGKYLLLPLDGDDVLVIHLGMSGQLLRAKTAREPMAKHTHVVITFTQGGQLRFVDPRTFGEMFVTEVDNVEKQVTELAHLGIDPLETAMSWEHFGSLLAQRHAKLKPLLMDQKFIAGIGNIYSDEILWGAGLRWDRMSDALTAQEVRRLYRSMMETLQEAVKHRGSSLADEQYVDLFGRPGEYQQFHNVYAREGAVVPAVPSRRGARALAGRSTFYCSACQV